MIRVLLTFVFLLLSMIAPAQSWQWARSAGGIANDDGISIATDAFGNVYVTGGFESPSFTIGSYTFANVGDHDIFIVKYDPNGNILWAHNAGGAGDELGRGICTDNSGNVYVTGYFYSPSITFGSFTLTDTGLGSIFIAKYDAAGNVLWAKGEGGTDSDEGHGIATDSSGNVFVTGYFMSNSIFFGSITLINSDSSYWPDIFIVKYDTNGNVLWAKSAGGGLNYDIGYSIATDLSGNVYVTGTFTSPIITFDSTTLINAGGNDIFMVKYDTIGNVIWASSAGGTGQDVGVGIATDDNGNVCFTGFFQSSSITFGTTTLQNTGDLDVFVVKFDAGGIANWAKNPGGGWSDDRGLGITTDGSGNIYVTGLFNSWSITFDSTTLVNAGSRDIFVVKYDTSGNVLWAISAGGISFDQGGGIATDSIGNVYVTGHFWSSAFSLGSTTLTNVGGQDIFTARLSVLTGLEESSFSEGINVFPNPFASGGAFTISGLPSEAVITAHDLLGETISETTASGSHESLTLDVPAGIYFLRVWWDTGQVVRKLEVVR